MKLDRSLPGVMTSGSGLDTPSPDYLPAKVATVAKEVLRAFPHTKRVGNYLLGKTLGEGSFAKVKEAMHTLTGEKVAIKVIDKKKAKADAYVRKNLRREGKLLQVVRHENVIRLYEIMETENSYYLVTELCQGGDLMDLICAQKRLEEGTARRYTRQIISAIDYLHKAGILHRDLKVENLLLDHNKDIKIIDFGLSNSVRVSHTKEGGSQAQEYCVTQCGSPAYAAPELLGNKKYGPKVDIWSIGVNMYAMLTGNLPFTVEPFNIKALHNKMLNADMNPIPEHLSEDCRDLLKKFLTPAPEERITLRQAMKHPWITDGNNRPMSPAPFPNKLSSDDLDHDVVKHMSANMDYRMSEVIRLATNNIPNNATATYHLLLRKLLRYNESLKSRGGSVDSRVTTPSSSKQAIRRSAHADVIKLNPINKSQQARDRKESRQPVASKAISQRRKTESTASVDHKKGSDTKSPRRPDTTSSGAEKTLVRRRIKNARVLASMQDDEENDDNEDKNDDDGDEDDSNHDEDDSDERSPTVVRRFTEDFQLEDTPVTPRTGRKTYTLPNIDQTNDKRKSGAKPVTTRNSCNPTINNTTARHDSTSSSSSGEEPKSMCSNPNPTSGRKDGISYTRDKGSLSDSATKTDKKTEKSAQQRPTAKNVVLEMGQYDRYSKDKSVSNKILPMVSPPRSFTQSPSRSVNSNRRVVNIVYPTFNNRSPNRQPLGNRTGRSLSRDSTNNSLNILGEKATVGGGRGIGIARSSLDSSSNRNSKSERIDAAGAEHRITLPTISPPILIRHQGHNTS